MQILQGQLVDIHTKSIYAVEIQLQGKKIKTIRRIASAPNRYFMPGFVDAHIHIESSMLVPSEFARIAVRHGTVATVSDPHEIANVLGVSGVDFMIENGNKVPLKFFFGAPSCVPATKFESAGAEINSNEIGELMQRPEIKYLAEMMNYPGVIYKDAEVLKKLEKAKQAQKPIDGHAPGLMGSDAKAYFEQGISTDHECYGYEEAQEKLVLGVKVLIREGSAAKNYTALAPLIPKHSENLMFCSDDKHPDDLLEGHINELVKRAWKEGYDFWDVLLMACVNPVNHYGLEVGLLREGDDADFLVLDDLKSLQIAETWIDGQRVSTNSEVRFDKVRFEKPNLFSVQKKTAADFALESNKKNIRVIEAIDSELITKEVITHSTIENGKLQTNLKEDILKIAVVNRYSDKTPAVAFIKNFGLKEGAIASSVAHDCHNIVAVGCTDEALTKAINLIIDNKGGLSAVSNSNELIIPLPVAGIMSDKSASEVGMAYKEIDAFAKDLGCTLKAPYMSLSFMALLVIPRLKLSDKGLFDGSSFSFVDVAVD